MATNKRRVASPDEIFDILDDVSGRKFATIGYVSSASLDYPKTKRINPETNRMKSYDDMEAFGRNMGYEGSVGGVIKLTRYNLQLSSHKEISTAYTKYKNDANDIRAKYGLPAIADKENNYTQTINYGGGVTAYGGDNEEKKGHVYSDQNTYGANIKSDYYIVGTDGKIDREVDKSELADYLKKSSAISGVSALRKMGADDERVQAYIDDMASLRFSYKRFEYSKILYVVATVNGEKLIYINDNLTSSVNDINIDPAEFIALVKQHYQEDIEGIESVNEDVNLPYETFAELFEAMDKRLPIGIPVMLSEAAANDLSKMYKLNERIEGYR